MHAVGLDGGQGGIGDRHRGHDPGQALHGGAVDAGWKRGVAERRRVLAQGSVDQAGAEHGGAHLRGRTSQFGVEGLGETDHRVHRARVRGAVRHGSQTAGRGGVEDVTAALVDQAGERRPRPGRPCGRCPRKCRRSVHWRPSLPSWRAFIRGVSAFPAEAWAVESSAFSPPDALEQPVSTKAAAATAGATLWRARAGEWFMRLHRTVRGGEGEDRGRGGRRRDLQPVPLPGHRTATVVN